MNYRKTIEIITFLYCRQMFSGTKDGAQHSQAERDNSYEKDTNSWQPSHPTALTTGDYGTSSSKVKEHISNTFHHNLPYDSYDPKYNNNPEGHGYQENYKPNQSNNWQVLENSYGEPIHNNGDGHRHRGHGSSDMHASSTSNKSKRVKSTGGTSVKISKGKKNGKRLLSTIKVKVKHHSRNLDTELRPPAM